MRQMQKKKGKDKVAATLILCFCLIALTSIFTIKASINKISESAGDVPVTQKAPTETNKAKDDAEAKADEETQSSQASAQVPTVDSRQQAPNTNTFISPVDMATAKIVKAYSMDMVVYNATLDQYMTHPGIDFEAPTGSGVKAAADGTVTDVYTDDAYGITIEVAHTNGYVSKYANLATDKMVETGDTVKQGQVISNVGKTALYESLDKAHLHFEMYKNGKICDPAKLISQ